MRYFIGFIFMIIENYIIKIVEVINDLFLNIYLF